jgi:hypothetical protein
MINLPHGDCPEQRIEADTHNWILPAIRWNQQVEQYDAFLAKNPNVKVFTDKSDIATARVTNGQDLEVRGEDF